ncbi:MAG: helix-turn-helix domain-containing protein [Pseudonocardia sp.]|nr:helix-turn-helix domain-containing protein [Pseudonocardia sp.]
MTPAPDPLAPRLADNRARQEELYGAPLGERVRRLTAALGVTQARLARALGMSPAMLSQLVSARRVKIGDPLVLARLLLLDQRCTAMTGPLTRCAVDLLLADVGRAHWQWSPMHAGSAAGGGARPIVRPTGRPDGRPDARHRAAPAGGSAAEALRRIAAPARLAAAAAALGPAFPELAEVLRQAAGRPG